MRPTEAGAQAFKLSEGQMASLKAIVLAGPDPAKHQVGRWRIVDLCRYVEERWAVSYSETGMLRILWSLDLSHRKTRPRHPQSDEQAQRAFKKGGCCLPEQRLPRRIPRRSGLRSGAKTRPGSGRRGAPAMSWVAARPYPARAARYRVTNRPGSSVPSARRATPGWRLVLTRLDTAAMNLFLAELSTGGRPPVRMAWC